MTLVGSLTTLAISVLTHHLDIVVEVLVIVGIIAVVEEVTNREYHLKEVLSLN